MKDAFVVPGPLDALVQQMFEIAGDPDMTSTDLALADARARIGEAMELAAITVPPFETDTWPAGRPLLDWVLRKLPEG
ncbi:MAG: hypothetical protein ACRDQA_17445, partial [Nocardioidaceae bacterium]